MIGFSAFFRLLWRRALLAQVFSVGMCISAVLLPVLTTYVPDYGISVPWRVNLFTLICPLVVGLFLVGQNTAEIQHTLFSWTLPNLRRNLFRSVLFVGAITAFLATEAYRWMGGPAPWIPTFTSGLLWYSIGIVTRVRLLSDDMVRRMSLYVAGAIRIAVFVLAFLSINRIADFYSDRPVFSVVLTLAGATLCFVRFHNVNVARKRSLDPISCPEDEAKIVRRTPVRRLTSNGPVTSIFSWIRAAEYENYSTQWGGCAGGAVKSSCIAVLIVIALPYLKDVQELGILIGLQMFAPGIPAMLALGYSANGSLFLQKGWLHPLSRAQLAKLSYLSCLLYNAGICGIMLLAILILEVFAEPDNWFGFRRPLALVFIVNPVFQWIRFRHGPFFTQIPAILVLFLCCILGVFGLGVGWFWIGLQSSIPLLYEIAVVTGLIVLSQGFFLYKVNRYFKTGDLV